MMDHQSFCSTSSREAGEQLFGTATRVDYWLALEVPQAWGRKAFEESELTISVKSHLSKVLEARPNTRLQLIKKGLDFAGNGIAFFVAVNHEEQPNLYEFRLSKYEDLLDLDISGILAERQEFLQYDQREPIFLVCTNGKRDPCCAKFGLPLHEAVRSVAGDNVWQTSHVGGHRFAANVVALPHGVFYGYLAPEDAPMIVDAQRAGTVHLPRYRGRSCYDDRVQAAETFLRQRTELLELHRFKLIEVTELTPNEWTFHFLDLLTEQTYCVQVRSEPAPFEVLKSCAEDAPVRLTQFKLVSYAVYGEVDRYIE
ncbi:MAG TPA: sucrase ferredoxin [Anaerolineales bacterium]|nr:sucrase ferredoxin [Anaerolineales bacterium]